MIFKNALRVVRVAREKVSRTLYHGTLADYEQDIRVFGLAPSVGDFVGEMYGYDVSEDELEELVFAADKSGLDRALTAITYHVGGKLGKSQHDVTEEDIARHGMLVIIYDGSDFFHQRADDVYDEEHPHTVEPGDWYSDRPVRVDKVLTGNGLIRFFKRYGMVPLKQPFGGNPKRLFQELMSLAVKAHPEIPKQDVLEKVRSLSPKEMRDYIKYYRGRGYRE